MINISLSESQSMPSEFSANHCSLTSRHPIFLRLTSHDPTEGIPANYGEIVVPGAGLNGLRLLPDVWRKNYETVCSYETVRPVTVLMNDLNSFVAEVWETVAKRGALPEGYTAVKFVQGSLGKDEYLNQIHNPTSLILSQVQDAGPEALEALIKHAAEKHTNFGQHDELRVHITMQEDRMEPNSAIVSDLEPTLRALGFRLSLDRPFLAFRKCPASEGRELEFTEFSFDDYNMLKSDKADSQATAVRMGKQIWEKAGTDGFKSVWVRDKARIF